MGRRRLPLGAFIAGALRALDADPDDDDDDAFRRATGVDLRAAAAAASPSRPLLLLANDELRQRHDAARMRYLVEFGDRIGIEAPSRSYLPPSPPGSSPQLLAGHECVTVSELASAGTGTSLAGRVLQGRVVAQPLVLSAVHIILEEAADLELVQVSIAGCLPKGLTHAQEWAMAERDFAPGTLLAVHDPHVRAQLGGPVCVVVRNSAQVTHVPYVSGVAPLLADMEQQGRQLQQEGRYEEAARCYTRVLRGLADDACLPNLLAGLAGALGKLGRPGESLAAASACIQIHPAPAQVAASVHKAAAWALDALGDAGAAAGYFMARAMQLVPAADVQRWAEAGVAGPASAMDDLRQVAASPAARMKAVRAIAGLPLQPPARGVAPSATALPASQAALDGCMWQAEQHLVSAMRSADASVIVAECWCGLSVLLRVVPIASLLSSRAACALQRGDRVGALLDARAALYLDPTQADAAHCAARVSQGLGWLPEARALLRGGLRAFPGDAALKGLAGELGVDEVEGEGAQPGESGGGSGGAAGGGGNGGGEPFSTRSGDGGGPWGEVARLRAQGKRHFLAGRFEEAYYNYSDALGALQGAVPAVRVLLLRLGQAQLDQGGEGGALRAVDYGRAAARLEAVCADGAETAVPLMASAVTALGVASPAMDMHASMDALYSRVDALPPLPPPSPAAAFDADAADAARALTRHLDAGDAHARAGDAAAAAREYEAARAYLPLLPAALLLSNRAECSLQCEGACFALGDACAALLLDPTQAKAASRLARALRAEGKEDVLARLCTASLAAGGGVDPGVAEVLAAELRSLPASARGVAFVGGGNASGGAGSSGPSAARCAGCGAALGGAPPKLCPACAATPYCSTQCRKAHRKEHKRACGK